MNRFINRSLQVMLTILCVGVCVVPVCAQRGKGIKKLTKALGEKPPLTGTAPVVRPPVTPRVPPTTAVAVPPAALHTVVERQVAQLQTKAPLTATLPVAFQNLDFLTGPQALQKLRPGWKSELMLSGFTRQQLDLVEQAFKETDPFLFETDEAGNWLSPRSAEWNYTDRFAKILTDNAFGEMSLNAGQIKTLFGKFSRLDDVFTQLNLQGFLLTHQGRAPKAGAPGEEGKLARKATYNLDKRDGRKMNPEVKEYVYGKTPAKLRTPKPSYGPKGRAPRRTPEEMWEEITQFMREHDGEIPGRNAEEDYERKLRIAWDHIYWRHQTSNDPYVRRLIKLHEETVRERTTDKTPQEWLETIEPWVLEHKRWPSVTIEEEKAMYKGAQLAMRNNPEDPASVRLKELKDKYGNNYAADKTPQEWLDIIEPWVLEHKRWPSQYNEEEKAMYKGAGAVMRNNPDDPASVRLKELKEKYGNKKSAK